RVNHADQGHPARSALRWARLSTDCPASARSVSPGWQAGQCSSLGWMFFATARGDQPTPHRSSQTESVMAGETTITLVGNLTADPELRFTPSGAAVANFTVASTPRTFDRQTNEWRDGEARVVK